jgi:hypothetical protein
MTGGTDYAPRADDQGAGAAGLEHPYGAGLALARWSTLHATPDVPPWMRAELVRLRAAFPEFSFDICPGWRGLMFEAWRSSLGAGGVYAVITGDARELWRELAGSPGGLRPADDRCGTEAR